MAALAGSDDRLAAFTRSYYAGPPSHSVTVQKATLSTMSHQLAQLEKQLAETETANASQESCAPSAEKPLTPRTPPRVWHSSFLALDAPERGKPETLRTRPMCVWRSSHKALEEPWQRTDHFFGREQLGLPPTFCPRLDIVPPGGKPIRRRSAPSPRARCVAGSVVTTETPPFTGPTASELQLREANLAFDRMAEEDATAKAAAAAVAAQKELEEGAHAWWEAYVVGKREATIVRRQLEEEALEEEELAQIMRKRADRAAEEELRLELDARRARLKVRAAEVDKMVAREKAEYVRLKEEERKAANARAAEQKGRRKSRES